MTTTNRVLKEWVEAVARQCSPERIHWCDGSDREYGNLVQQMVDDGTLIALNQQTHPGCYLHRSNPTDVARTEHLTFVCTPEREDAGINNNWMAPDEAHRLLDGLFDGCMRGRTMYVVPYCMGPIKSPLARCGVEITDSPYVVANLKLMTRMGKEALERIEREGGFVKGQHSIGDLDPKRRYIMHFPDDLLIRSIGSGYGGNALLSKKCHALRIASYQARQEGWLAEHMLILGIETPAGETHYLAAAFPSACGKTNLAMLRAPQSLDSYKISTIGDDICWLQPGEDGRLWAINPEAGFFGVVPGTNEATNYNAYAMLNRDALFANVAVTEDGQPWWEGKKDGTPALNWRGEPVGRGNGPAAHPNARFTVSMHRCPSYSPKAEEPRGVPLSAIVFGGRRASLAPLVYEAKDWAHGVMVGASVASETTAAQSGAVGVVRRDPMAMKPFCGYNYGDYWAHWLGFSERADKLPRIFHVNWFRKDDEGRFIWPGFGDNLRVLAWIVERCAGRAEAVETPIGYLPVPDSLNIEGLDLDPEDLRRILSVDSAEWRKEIEDIGEYFNQYGDRLPRKLREAQGKVLSALLS